MTGYEGERQGGAGGLGRTRTAGWEETAKLPSWFRKVCGEGREGRNKHKENSMKVTRKQIQDDLNKMMADERLAHGKSDFSMPG